MNMIEKVAQAIADNIVAGLPDGVTIDARYAAVAAIEALREPEDYMIDAGIEAKMKLYEKMTSEGLNTRTVVVANHPAGTIYVAMIDAALQEE